jgi:hypothetical protein
MNLYRKEHIAVGRKRKKGKKDGSRNKRGRCQPGNHEYPRRNSAWTTRTPRGHGRVGGVSGSGVPELDSWIGLYPRWWHGTYCLSLLFADPFTEIRRKILKFHSIPFARCEKSYRMSVGECSGQTSLGAGPALLSKRRCLRTMADHQKVWEPAGHSRSGKFRERNYAEFRKCVLRDDRFIRDGVGLCTNCARIERFQPIRVSFEREADSPIC